MSRPKTVKVTVYSSRNLRPRKGDGDPLSWVVFGFGNQKCCTAQIRDRHAKWNEESTFTITDPRLPLKLTVKDKNEPLGQIIIPVDDLPSDEHFLKWVPLGPHRKNPHPYGEICLDCWIEDFYDESEGYIERENLPTLKKKKNGRLRQKFLGSIENLSPRAARKASVGMGVMSVKGSVSMEDISGSSLRRKQETLPPKNNNYLQVSSTSSSVLPSTSYTNFDMRRANSTLAIGLADQRRLSMGSAEIASLGSLPVIKEQTYPPKITNFIPNSGSAEGGTLIQITGKNLGLAKEDIIRLMVAGCNCISTLEYYTPNKIMCTTTESEGIGPISITTRSGGTSSSKLMYEFVASKKQEDIDLDILDDGTDSGRCSGSSEADRDKDEVIEDLKGKIDLLTRENGEMRTYIDKLVVYLMEKYPDALESSKMYR